MTEKDLTIYSVTVTESFKIRKSFVSAWTLSCFLLLLNSQKDNVYWILAQEPAFFPFCYVQKRRLLLTKHWKFRKKVLIWHAEVLPIIIWKIRFMSQQEISVIHLKSTENSLLMLL